MRSTKLGFALLVALYLSGCATTGQGREPPERAVPEPAVERAGIVYDLRSWGQPVSHWQVNQDGTGELWRIDRGSRRNIYDIRKFRIAIHPEAMIDIERYRESTLELFKVDLVCDHRLSDAPLATIEWEGDRPSRRYSFDFGCKSKQADELGNRIRTLDGMVREMAVIEAAPLASEHFGPP